MKTPREIMNPLEDELERGQQAARDLVAHMKRLEANATVFEISDGAGVWTVAIEWKNKGAVN